MKRNQMTSLKITSIMVCVVALLSACAQTPSQDYSKSYETNPETSSSARVHTELGAEYFRLGNYEVALSEFNLAIEKDGSYALAHNGLGMVQAALGDKVKAEASFKRAIQIQPNSSESHNNYGNFLCGIGRYDESVTQFLDAIKNPLYTTPQIAYTNAGICALRNKKSDLAEDYFNRALQIDRSVHTAAYQLAVIQLNRGDALLANSTLQQALNIQPTPESLWLGIKVARLLQNKDNEVAYAVQLKKLFPDSKESKLLSNGQ